MRVVGGRIGRLIVDARAIINNLAATQSERAGRSRFREDTREKHDGSLSLSLSLSLPFHGVLLRLSGCPFRRTSSRQFA